MGETSQEERDELEDRLLGNAGDTLVTENHDLRVDQVYRLLSDADRLAEAEALLRVAGAACEPDAPEVARRIDAFLSGGGE